MTLETANANYQSLVQSCSSSAYTNPIAKQLTNLSMLYIYFNLDTQITEEVVQQWIVEEKMTVTSNTKTN